MAIIKSNRAKEQLLHPRFFQSDLDPEMKKYPGHKELWVKVEWEMNNVKNLSFYGNVPDHEKVLLESWAFLLIGKPIIKLKEISLRECEAFLRDKNSEAAIEGMTENDELELKKVVQWMAAFSPSLPAKEYAFSSEKGPFRNLKLTDKIREIKAFLNSPEILTLYQNHPRPELVDVEELTVYIHAPYDTQREKSLFEELHILGVEAFQEENLNFIPES